MTISGAMSWFGGPHDSGGPTSYSDHRVQGIAVANTSTQGGYWQVHYPNGRVVVEKQTDYGPAGWTGKILDVGVGALSRAGYTEGNFPTGAHVTATYLGKGAAAAARAGGTNTPITGGHEATATSTSSLSDGGLFAGYGGDATKALLYVVLVGAGVAVAGYGAARLGGVKSPIKDAATAAVMVPK